jgi:type I restriction enzyme R subunit
MTVRHSSLFALRSGKSGLGIYTTERDAALLTELQDNEARKKDQAEKGFDGLTFFVYRTLLAANITDAEAVSNTIRTAFIELPNWSSTESQLRELRNRITFAIAAACDDLAQVSPLVDELFTALEKGKRRS